MNGKSVDNESVQTLAKKTQFSNGGVVPSSVALRRNSLGVKSTISLEDGSVPADDDGIIQPVMYNI